MSLLTLSSVSTAVPWLLAPLSQLGPSQVCRSRVGDRLPLWLLLRLLVSGAAVPVPRPGVDPRLVGGLVLPEANPVFCICSSGWKICSRDRNCHLRPNLFTSAIAFFTLRCSVRFLSKLAVRFTCSRAALLGVLPGSRPHCSLGFPWRPPLLRGANSACHTHDASLLGPVMSVVCLAERIQGSRHLSRCRQCHWLCPACP